jgi:hypothetical protein
MPARELWEQLGSPSEFLQIPYGQARYHLYRGELDEALRLDKDLLRLSHQGVTTRFVQNRTLSFRAPLTPSLLAVAAVAHRMM